MLCWLISELPLTLQHIRVLCSVNRGLLMRFVIKRMADERRDWEERMTIIHKYKSFIHWFNFIGGAIVVVTFLWGRVVFCWGGEVVEPAVPAGLLWNQLWGHGRGVMTKPDSWVSGGEGTGFISVQILLLFRVSPDNNRGKNLMLSVLIFVSKC